MCRLLRWLLGAEEEAPEPAGKPGPVDDLAADREWFRERAKANLPRCEECGGVRTDAEAIMHRRWCSSCDMQWVEDWILYPLIARLGRKGARRALTALVRGEIGLPDVK